MADRILVVDGESAVRRDAQHYLEGAGYAVRTFSAMDGIYEALSSQPSLVLISAILPDGSGLDLCRHIRQDPAHVSTPIVVLTDGTSEEQSCAALEAGADDCLAKPFSPGELKARVQTALRCAVHP